LPAASTYAGDIDVLFDVITLLVGIPFLIASFLFFTFILRFKKKEGVPSMYITGTEHKYMKWIHRAHIPILTFDVIIVVMAVNVWYDVKQDLPEANSTIRVTAQQWAWTFTHPGPDNVLDTADDILTVNELHVAKDTLYHFKLESLDVLHNFSVPVFRLKQDAIPADSRRRVRHPMRGDLRHRPRPHARPHPHREPRAARRLGRAEQSDGPGRRHGRQ
jgi:cytochrome c oxidase subunit 2